MQNYYMDALSKGSRVANSGMNIARSMLDSVQASINSSSKLGFELANLFRVKEAEKFNQLLNLEQLALNKKKEQFYEQYKTDELGLAREKFDFDKKYKTNVLGLRERELDLKSKSLEPKQTATPAYTNTFEPLLEQAKGNTQQSTLAQKEMQPTLQRPEVESLVGKRAIEPVAGINKMNIDTKDIQLRIADYNKKLATTTDEASKNYYRNIISALRAVEKATNIDDKRANNIISNTLDSIKYLKDVSGNPYINQSELAQVKASIAKATNPQEKLKLLVESLKPFDSRGASIEKLNGLKFKNVNSSIQASTNRLKDKNLNSLERAGYIKKIDNDLRKDPLAIEPTMLDSVLKTPEVLAQLSDSFGPEYIRQLEESKRARELVTDVWANPKNYEDIYKAGAGIAEAIGVAPEDKVDKEDVFKAYKQAVGESIKRTGIDVVTPLLSEIGYDLKGNMFDDIFSKYGYNPELMNRDNIDYAAIAKALGKANILDGYQVSKIAQGMPSGKVVAKRVFNDPKTFAKVIDYIRKNRDTDTAKTLALGFIVHPTFSKYFAKKGKK